MCAFLSPAFPIHMLRFQVHLCTAKGCVTRLGQGPSPMLQFSSLSSWAGMIWGQVIQVLSLQRLLMTLFVPLPWAQVA